MAKVYDVTLQVVAEDDTNTEQIEETLENLINGTWIVNNQILNVSFVFANYTGELEDEEDSTN